MPYNSRAWPGSSGTKRTADQVLRVTPSCRARELDDALRAVVRPERQYHDAALGELVDQRLRDRLGRRRDDDAVVGRVRRAGR